MMEERSILPPNDTNNNDFDVAKRESLGFFNDVPSQTWNRLRKKVKDMSPNYNPVHLPFKKTGHQPAYKPGSFYQNNYEPDFVCQHELRIGRITTQDECLVYSIGSNNDFSFEQSVLDNIGHHCEIHTFDFGNFSAGAAKLGYRLHKGENKRAVIYHQIGLGADEPPKYKSLKTVVNELGHNNRTVDIFKIDCEGCEWSTAKHWFEADITLRQIQIELHKSNPKTTPEFFDLFMKTTTLSHIRKVILNGRDPKMSQLSMRFSNLHQSFLLGMKERKEFSELVGVLIRRNWRSLARGSILWR